MVDRTEGLHYLEGQGWVDLDAEARRDRLDGYAVISGLEVTSDGTDLTLDVSAGSATVGQTSGSVDTVSLGSAGTVTLDAGDPSNPRKDTIYIDTTGTLQVEKGTPEAALPSGNARFDTFQPEPPQPSVEGTILAEVWVPTGASTISSGDVRDRRQPSELVGDSVVAQSLGADTGTINTRITYPNGSESYDSPHAYKVSWTRGPNPNTAHSDQATVFDGTYVYAISGFNSVPSNTTATERYDPPNESWDDTIANIPTARRGLAGVYQNDKIYAFAGFTSSQSSVLEIYDISTDTWSSGTNLPTTAYNLTGASDGTYIYITGGTGNLTGVYRYDPSTDSYTTLPNLPTGRQNHNTIFDGTDIWVLGGDDGNFNALNSVMRFDIASGSWDTSPSNLPVATTEASAVYANGGIFYFAGFNGNPGDSAVSDLSYTWRYDIANDDWSLVGSHPYPRAASVAATDGTRLYHVGGNHTVDGRVARLDIGFIGPS